MKELLRALVLLLELELGGRDENEEQRQQVERELEELLEVLRRRI